MAVSDYFRDESFDEILARLLDYISDEFDKRQGSHAYNMQAPTAAELAQFYIALDQVLTYGFAGPDMPREYLIRRAAELGISPTPATRATGKLTFTAQADVTIPEGTRVRTDSDEPIYAETTEASQALTAGQSVTLDARAVDAGANGNVSSDEYIIVTGNLAGVITVTNAEPFEGGTDEESTEALLNRYYSRAREPATSGNVAHYRQWATSRPGVSIARVFPLWDGPGTVKVAIVGDDYTAPDSAIVADVQAYIDPNENGDGTGEAPIGAACTVVAVGETAINVSATLTIDSGANIGTITDEFTDALRTYLAKLVEDEDNIVRYTQINGLLLDVKGVVDFSDLTLNGITGANVEIGDEDVPVVGTVNFVEG